ncbi:MAG: prepilin-type N-terminal cleavage/methylation domain-containing protein [Acidobacteriota bacterium]|jgi:hypothetical protein
MTHSSAIHPIEPEGGFSLIEVMVAMFMATLVFLMMAQMIGVGVEANRAATDTTRAGALAADQMESLTRLEYADLVPGGNINADVNGYSETLDIDADGINDYVRRWEITDLGAEMRIRVRVISLLDVIGPPKEATYVTLKADR